LCSTSVGQTNRDEDSILKKLNSKVTLSQYSSIGNVMRFNNDTILVSGYLSDNSGHQGPKNVVYQSFDNGNNWKKYYFKGDAWIYNTHFENDGKVWMGGSDEFIYYSFDYGSTWNTKAKPFKPINRVLSIYMVDSVVGIAGGLNNGLAMTNDNWKTTGQIPSPLDQKRFQITKGSARDRINKVAMADSLLLIDQNEHIYFSKIDPIEWKIFNVPTLDFKINKKGKTIELYSLGNKVYVLDYKLNPVNSYLLPPDTVLMRPLKNSDPDVSVFLASGIKAINIKGVKYKFAGMGGGCLRGPIYKEKVEQSAVKENEKLSALKQILATSLNYRHALAPSFSFAVADFENYKKFYEEEKKSRKEEKVWGGDFTSLLEIENDLFKNPGQTLKNCGQSVFDAAFKVYSLFLFSSPDSEPYNILNVINNHSDTLSISNKNSDLFSLPWTIEYKGRTFWSYDTRITEFVRTTIGKESKYYDKLFAGKLIYRLIEQKIISGLEYKITY